MTEMDCDKCDKYKLKDYKQCPKCGANLRMDINAIKRSILNLVGTLPHPECTGEKPQLRNSILEKIDILYEKSGRELFLLYELYDDDSKLVEMKSYYVPTDLFDKSIRTTMVLTREEIEEIYPFLKYFPHWSQNLRNEIERILGKEANFEKDIYLVGTYLYAFPIDRYQKPILPFTDEYHLGDYDTVSINDALSNGNLIKHLGPIKRENILPAMISMFGFDIME